MDFWPELQGQDVSWQFEADREIAFVKAGRLTCFVGNDGLRGDEVWSAWTSVLAGDRAAALRDLSEEVAAAGLPAGIVRALQATLESAGRAPGLDPFIRQVTGLQGKPIPDGSARRLLRLASDIDAMVQRTP